MHAGSAPDDDMTIVELPSDDLIEAVLSPAAPPVTCAAPAFVDDGDVEIIEVIFDPSTSGGVLDHSALLFSEAADLTEPCPPLEEAGELDAPTPSVNVAALSVEAVYVAALEAEALSIESDASGMEPQAPVDIEVAPPSVELASPHVDVAPPSVEVAPPHLEVAHVSTEAPPGGEFSLLVVDPEVESELPPWALIAPEVHELTPPPRVALPERPPSDVDELLLRLDEIPLALDDLPAGLRRLAGLELTPPPPALSFER